MKLNLKMLLIDRKKENGNLECKWRTEKNMNVFHWKKCILFKH